MKKLLRIYVDTSVIGGCFDPEFETWSRALLGDFRSRRLLPMVSDVTAAEVEEAPPSVQRIFDEVVDLASRVLPVGREALDLLATYHRRRILSPRFRNDMLHIAVATIARADALVSWNFRHMVRLDKIRAFNAANEAAGHPPLSIHSPREVATHEDR